MTLREIYDLIKAQAQALFHLPEPPTKRTRSRRATRRVRKPKTPTPEQPSLFGDAGGKKPPEQPSLPFGQRDKSRLKPVKKVVREKGGGTHTQTYWEKVDADAKPAAGTTRPAEPAPRPEPTDPFRAKLNQDPGAALDELEREVERLFATRGAADVHRKKIRPKDLPRGNDPGDRLQRMMVKLRALLSDLREAADFAYDMGRPNPVVEDLIKRASEAAANVGTAAEAAQAGVFRPKTEPDEAQGRTEKPNAEKEPEGLPAIARPSEQRSQDAKAVADFLERAGLREYVLRAGDEDGSFHLRIPNPPFLPLVIERHPGPDHEPRLYLTHYRHADPDDPMSDLLLDGELVYRVHPDGRLELEATAVHDPFRGYESRGRDADFARMFARNLVEHFYHEVPRERWEGKNAPEAPVEAHERDVPAPDTLPLEPSEQNMQEGAEKTRVFADGVHTYRLKNGRWHRVDEDEGEHPHAAKQEGESVRDRTAAAGNGTLYYRMHDGVVDEPEFMRNAGSWKWDFDDSGALYERELPGVYSAFEDVDDLLNYHDGTDDSTPVAIFEGREVERPHSDARGEVLVEPARLVGWTTVAELKKKQTASDAGAESDDLEEREGGSLESHTPAGSDGKPGGLDYSIPFRQLLERLPRFGFALLPKATVAQRTKANQRAVELLERLEREQREPTPEEREVLAAYTGEGGLSGDLNAHYTPTPLAAAMWGLLQRVAGATPQTVLEPSMGNGVFLHTAPEGTKVTGIELSKVSGAIGKLLHEPSGHRVYPGMAFEDYNLGEGQEHTYDAVIANPPYGIRGSLITRGKPWLAKAEQYFIDASLDRMKDGGVGVYLINPGPVENRSTRDFRTRLLARAEVVGAYQLPSSVFKESNSGVPPVVLVLRKRPDAEGMTLLRLVQRHGEEALGHAGVLTGAAQDFLEGKLHLREENLLGDWSGETTYHGYKKIEGELDPERLERLINGETFAQPADLDALKKFYGDDYDSAHAWATSPASDPERGRVQEGTVSEDGRLVFRNHRWHTIQGEDPRLAAAVDIAKELQDYVHVLNNGAPADAEARRQAVLESLQRYLEEYGNPHEHLKDEIKRIHGLAHLVSAVTPQGEIAEHLQRPVTGEDASGNVDYTDPYAVAAHLARQRRLTPSRMASVLVGGHWTTQKAMEWLVENGYAMDESGRWLPEDEFYVGDVYERAEALEAAAEAPSLTPMEREVLRAQAKKFREKLPRKSLEDVEITARDIYVRPEIVADFIRDVVDPGGQYRVTRTETGIFQVEPLHGGELPAHVREFAKYLNYDTPVQRLSPEQTRTMTQAQLAALKAEYREAARRREKEFAEQFKAWAASSDYREELEEHYNRAFNSYIPPKYSDRPLEIPDWKGPPLHSFQTEAVRHALDTGSSIMALDVGLGKTYAGMALAQMLEHEGRARRIVHVMPKSLMGNWRNSYAELGSGRWYAAGDFALPDGVDEQTAADAQVVYDLLKRRDLASWNELEAESRLPADRFRAALNALARADAARGIPGEHVMVIGETFDPKKKVWREDKMQDVATKLTRLAADPSITRVLITRDKFSTIPVRGETLERYVKDDVVRAREFEEAERDARKKRSARDWVAQMEKAMEKASAKLFGDQVKAVHWEDLGVDAIISDEHHAYKNLHAAPSSFGETPKFLGAGSESQRAADMLIKSRFVRDRNGGGGVYALTATPTKNSPLEVYNMLRYVTDAVDRLAPTPKAFIDRYAELGNALVATPGGVEMRTAVLGFKNLGELRGLMNRYIFRRTAQEVGLKIPEREDHEHIFEMHPEQHAAYRALAVAAERAAGNREAEGDAHFFSYLARMRFLTLDPALYDPESLGHLSNPRFQKAAEITRNALKEGGKVVMFMDLGQQASGENPAEDMGKEALQQYAQQHGLPHEGMTEAKLRRLVAKHIEEGRANAYERLKQHLVEAGVPEDQIAIVTSKTAKSSAARADIEAAFKAGKLRVIVGSTGVIGEGFNLQTGTTDMIHLDIPWDPGTYWQRLGRAVRQGNTQEKVRNHVLLARGSVDAMTYGTMLGKKGWTDILWNSTEDRARNADALDSENDPYTMMLMQTADDPDAVKKILEEQKQKRIEQARIAKRQASMNKLGQAAILHNSLRKQRGLVEQAKAHLEKAHQDAAPDKIALWEKRLADRSAKLQRLEGEWRSRLEALKGDEHIEPAHIQALESGRPFVVTPTGAVFVEGGVVRQTRGEKSAPYRIVEVDPVTKTVRLQPLVPLQKYGGAAEAKSYKAEDLEQKPGITVATEVDQDELAAELERRLAHAGPTGLRQVHPDVVRRHQEAVQRGLRKWAEDNRFGSAWVVNQEGKPEYRERGYRSEGGLLREGERMMTNTPEDVRLWQQHHGDDEHGYDRLAAIPFAHNPQYGRRHYRVEPTEPDEYLVKAPLVDIYRKLMGRMR